MKQELTIPKEESTIEISVGDMFVWTEESGTTNVGKYFIYLGDDGVCVEMPLKEDSYGTANRWCDLKSQDIKEAIIEGQIKRLPPGTTLTITQE